MSNLKSLLILTFIILLPVSAFSQVAEGEIDWEKQLETQVENPNPVYMPVIGVGGGVMTYLGDIKGGQGNFLVGQPAFRVTLSTFADAKHYSKYNFFLNLGNIGVENGTLNSQPYRSFKTNVINAGVNIDYGFGNFIRAKKVRPFVAIGAEFLNFNPRTDSFYFIGKNKYTYYRWNDGTLRNYQQFSPVNKDSVIRFLKYDNDYETALRGNQKYNLQGFAIPLEAGLDFFLSDRATVRFGTSLHLAFTDYLDGVKYPAKGGFLNSDKILFTYATLHYDLWSSEEVLTIENYYADLDPDEWAMVTADEDYDNVLDFADKCPGTQYGVQVDSVGCPLDDDKDGVPNYLDKESDTAPGAIIDQNGITLSDDQVIAMLDNSLALSREDFWRLLRNYRVNKYAGQKNLVLPEKFRIVDLNRDGYISFDELLRAIDNYFDYNSPFTVDDIYELNDYFFAQ